MSNGNGKVRMVTEQGQPMNHQYKPLKEAKRFTLRHQSQHTGKLQRSLGLCFCPCYFLMNGEKQGLCIPLAVHIRTVMEGAEIPGR